LGHISLDQFEHSLLFPDGENQAQRSTGCGTIKGADVILNTAVVSLVYLEHDLRRIVTQWHEALPDAPIYLFCDGCDEETKAQIQHLLDDGIVILPEPIKAERRGYCNAMRNAYSWMHNNTSFEKILMVDSDGCYPPASVKKVYDSDAPNAIACRLNRKERWQESWYRYPYMRSEKYVMWILFGLWLKDYSAGLRLLDIAQADEVGKRTKYSKWGFYMEFDVLWYKMYGPLLSIPVDYNPQPTKTFSLRRMPDILWSEMVALLHLKWDLIFKRNV
jgi:hypothetical protein